MIRRPTIKIVANDLYIVGSINFDTVVALRKAGDRLIKRQKTDTTLKVNFSEVDECDKSCIILMTAWLRFANKIKKPICFVDVPNSLEKLVTLLGVGSLLPLSFRP